MYSHPIPSYRFVTPKAFANVGPGLERSDNPALQIKSKINPERVRHETNPSRVYSNLGVLIPGLSLRSNPGLQIKSKMNPERVRHERNPSRVYSNLGVLISGLALRSNPGLKLANAFGVKAWVTH